MKRIEDIIREDLLREAEEIEREVKAANLPPMDEETSARIWEGIQQKIKEYEKRKKL